MVNQVNDVNQNKKMESWQTYNQSVCKHCGLEIEYVKVKGFNGVYRIINAVTKNTHTNQECATIKRERGN